jgi:hypothetical protein
MRGRELTTDEPARRNHRGARLGLFVLVAAVVSPAWWVTTPASAAAGRPDLTVSKIAAPAAAKAGTSIRVSSTVKNAARKGAGASTTSFSLSRDRKVGGDIRLAATSKVKSLKPKRSLSRATSATIPAGTSAGSYYLIACADSKKKVREGNEKNNCRAGRTPIRVTRAAPTQPTGPTPPGRGKLTIAPATLEFGAVTIGSGPVQKSLTATNTGTAALPVLVGGALAGDDAFTMIIDECAGQVLAAGSSCRVLVRFNPVDAGNRTSTLTVRGGAGSHPISATAGLRGTVVDPLGARLTSELGGTSFGTVPQGITTPTTTFTIVNTGTNGSGEISTPAFTAGADNGFEIVSETCGGETLGVGDSCTVSVNLTARAQGSLASTLTIAAAPGGTLDLALTATGENAFMVPNGLDFGTLAVGSTSAVQTFSPANTGDDKNDVSVTVTGPDADQFEIPWQSCAPQVSNHQSCSVQVQFKPTSPGPKSAQVTLRSTPGGIVNVALTGAADSWSVAPAGGSFSAFAGETTDTTSFTFTNLDDPTTGPLSSQLTGPDASQFVVVSDGCAGVTLPTGSTCSVAVAFNPTGSPGSRSAVLTVAGTPGGPKNVALAGTVLEPATFSVTPAGDPISFGTIPAGNGAHAPWQLMLRNTGDATSEPVSLALVSENVPGQFVIDPFGCTAKVLAPNETCFFKLAFQPTQTGSFSASLTITAPNAVGVSVSLSGVGS